MPLPPGAPAPTPDENRALRDVTDLLHRQFAQEPPDDIDRRVADAHASFAQARIRQFVPLLVQRRVAGDLDDRGQS